MTQGPLALLDGVREVAVLVSITRVTGSWGEALRRAGLSGKSRPAPPPAPDYKAWDYDSCVAAVARYLAQLPEGARSRANPANYSSWAAEQDHAPETTVIRHHCKTWASARRAGVSRLSPSRSDDL